MVSKWWEMKRCTVSGIARLSGVTGACMGVIYFLLARYGFGNMLGGRKYWRFLLLLVLFVASMLGGFRSFFALLLMTFFFVFCLEGLLKSRYVFIFAAAGFLLVGSVIPIVNKLPLAIQRTLSFLPVNVDPVVRYSANASTEWRLQIWSAVIPEIPRYLWLGRGLGIPSRSLGNGILPFASFREDAGRYDGNGGRLS